MDDTLGTPYDYASIMHDGNFDFSNGSMAMEAPEPIGHMEKGLSEGDILRLRLLYQCESGPCNYSDYVANTCTVDCKCWKGMEGCGGVDDACQGNLICDPSTNSCVSAQPDNSWWPPSLLCAILVAMIAVLLLLGIWVGRSRLARRNDYQTLQ